MTETSLIVFLKEYGWWGVLLWFLFKEIIPALREIFVPLQKQRVTREAEANRKSAILDERWVTAVEHLTTTLQHESETLTEVGKALAAVGKTLEQVCNDTTYTRDVATKLLERIPEKKVVSLKPAKAG